MSFTPPATSKSGARNGTIRIAEKTGARGRVCLLMGCNVSTADACAFSSGRANYEFEAQTLLESLKYGFHRYMQNHFRTV